MSSTPTEAGASAPLDDPRAPEKSGALPAISVVIPTRNRQRSLLGTLEALRRQTYPPAEVIIVDAGDRPIDDLLLAPFAFSFEIRHFPSSPSVCRQRNLGIAAARCPYVFLCDDDIEPEPRYLERIAGYIARTGAGAVAGLCMERTADGEWRYEFLPDSPWSLIVSFLFQTGIWYDPRKVDYPGWAGPLFRRVQDFYRERGNTFSLAGWPLVTDFGDESFTTAIYGLGASVIRRDWLLDSPYSEELGAHGIGDNYGVAIGFRGSRPIHVLKSVRALHHKSPENRLAGERSYYLRILAMARFMRSSERFTAVNRLFLLWSVLGNGIGSLARGRLRAAGSSLRLIYDISTNRKPA